MGLTSRAHTSANASQRPVAARPAFLTGLRVLEFGDGVAGASAARSLCALGADVTTVVDMSSVHRRGSAQVESATGRTSLLAVALDRGKNIVDGADLDVDGVLAMLADDVPDLVIVDRVGGAGRQLGALAGVDAYASFVELTNRAAWVTVSAFGLSGPRRDAFATDLTLAAASGLLASVRDPSDGHPLKLAGNPSLLTTGHAAVLACCHALDLACDGPVHLDLSALEATVAMGPLLELTAALLGAVGPQGARRYGAPASFYPCADGLIRISAMEDHQWQGVVATMGDPAWAQPFSTPDTRIDNAHAIDVRIEEWTRSRSKLDVEHLMQSNGVPATAVYAPTEILASPQLLHRGAFDDVTVDGGPQVRVVGSPYRLVASAPTDGADRPNADRPRRRGLRGLQVLEVSHVLAGPLAGALLGALGASVTKLEDVRRIDMYRRRGPYIDGVPGEERSAYFAIANHSKRSVAFDVQADPSRLAALLDSTDVVLENVGGSRADRLGVSARRIAADHPGVLGISSSGFGQDGPFAAYRAYAYNLQASCGMGFLTRNERGEPAEIDLAWADLISGYAIAAVIAAWAVGPRGNDGAAIDFAMADLVIGCFNSFIAAASIDPDGDAGLDRANRLAPYAPHGVYATLDGFVALAVDGDDEHRRLAECLGAPSLLADEFAHADARLRHLQTLDEAVTAAVATRSAAEVVEAVVGAGLAAEAVVPIADIPTSPVLAEREFFTSVEHGEWGVRRFVGLPWRRFGAGPIPLAPPPCLVPIE